MQGSLWVYSRRFDELGVDNLRGFPWGSDLWIEVCRGINWARGIIEELFFIHCRTGFRDISQLWVYLRMQSSFLPQKSLLWNIIKESIYIILTHYKNVYISYVEYITLSISVVGSLVRHRNYDFFKVFRKFLNSWKNNVKIWL